MELPSLARTLILGIFLLASALAAEAQLVHIVDLGYPGFAVPGRTLGVSDSQARVAVGEGVFDFGFFGFHWRDDALAPLGAPAAATQASAVTPDGEVIVGQSDVDAYRWQNGAFEDLAIPGMVTEADDVSADGRTVVGNRWLAGSSEAIRWVDGVAEGLGDLPGGEFDSEARGVSGDGSIVVGLGDVITGPGGVEAFRWEGGTMSGLGDLPGGSFSSQAHAISADGTTIVGESQSGFAGGNNREAFRWTAAVGMIGLGALGAQTVPASQAWDVSGEGGIVVGNSSHDDGTQAFVWDEANGMRRLVDVLRDQFGIDATALGWRRLTHANAISDDGRVIGGEGERLAPPAATAWMAVLPHPPGTFVCDIATGNPSYTDWQVIAASVLRYANLDSAPLPARVRLQLTVPGGLTVDLIDAGADRGIALPAGLDIDLGPVPLFVAQPWLPRGTYALRCALEDPATGEMKTSGRSSFTLN